eukprot:13006-Eustigmatos_ZCMA.PRE.1
MEVCTAMLKTTSVSSRVSETDFYASSHSPVCYYVRRRQLWGARGETQGGGWFEETQVRDWVHRHLKPPPPIFERCESC